jgi:hypothetical protein
MDGFLPTTPSNNIWFFLILPLESYGANDLLLIKYKSRKITVHGL